MPLTLTFLGYLFVVASHHLPGRRRRRAAAAAFAADLEAGNGDAAPGPKRGTIVALVLLTATVFCPRAFFFFFRRGRGGAAEVGRTVRGRVAAAPWGGNRTVRRRVAAAARPGWLYVLVDADPDRPRAGRGGPCNGAAAVVGESSVDASAAAPRGPVVRALAKT